MINARLAWISFIGLVSTVLLSLYHLEYAVVSAAAVFATLLIIEIDV